MTGNNFLINLISRVLSAIIVLFIHEYTKALVSTALGDKVPQNTGRLTLNPFKHLEPIGFFCTIFFNFGWGNPVETSPLYYKDKKMGTILTYVTPSVVNLLFGGITAIVIFLIQSNVSYGTTGYAIDIVNFLYNTAFLSVGIAFFNIIPIYPLDGAKILNLFLSPNSVIKLSGYEKILQILLIILLSMGVISSVIYPLSSLFLSFTKML